MLDRIDKIVPPGTNVAATDSGYAAPAIMNPAPAAPGVTGMAYSGLADWHEWHDGYDVPGPSWPVGSAPFAHTSPRSSTRPRPGSSPS